MSGLLSKAWLFVQAQAERRLPALTRLRETEALPIAIHRRRIYVLPSRFGLFFSGLLLAMAAGALNYNNNPALMLVFLIGSSVHTALLRGWLGLSGLHLVEVSAPPVHAGAARGTAVPEPASSSAGRAGKSPVIASASRSCTSTTGALR